MAGLGSRFTQYGFSTNKYLLPIDIQKTKMIEKAILTLNIPIGSQFIFIIREEAGEDIQLRTYLQEICDKNNYKCIILSVNYLTEGPTSTCYLAKDYINNELPLIISNSDQILNWNFIDFFNTSVQYDGSVLTYTPKYELIIGNIDKHSFVRFDDITNKPVEFVEKTIISNQALVGVHYYKKGEYFVEAAEYLFENNIRAPNGEFYLSYTYQALLNLGYNIGTYCLTEGDNFYPVGEPQDYFTYYNYYNSFFKTDICNYPYVNLSYFSTGKSLDICEIKYSNKGDSITLSNSLFIPFCSQITSYISGEHMNYTFIENTYYLHVYNIENNTIKDLIDTTKFTRGWLIGNFEPNIKRTTEYEIGILQHKKDEKWAFHYHSQTTEINILISGEMLINDIFVKQNTIFIFEKNMISCPLFLSDCTVLCIKIPSLPNDKIII